MRFNELCRFCGAVLRSVPVDVDKFYFGIVHTRMGRNAPIMQARPVREDTVSRWSRNGLDTGLEFSRMFHPERDV